MATTLTFENFETAFKKWCALRNAQFHFYWPLKGGWELWVQADFVAYLLTLDNTVEVLREQAIYKSSKKSVDWLVNALNDDNNTKIAIELKCQSFENSANFISGVYKDVQKLENGNVSPVYSGCQSAMIGIYFADKQRSWLIQNGFTEVFRTDDIGCAILKINGPAV
jgi:hypothetical protein